MARKQKKYKPNFTVDVHSYEFKTKEDIAVSSKNKSKIIDWAIVRYLLDGSDERMNIPQICKHYNISLNSFKSRLYSMTEKEAFNFALKNFDFPDIREIFGEDENYQFIVKEALAFSLKSQYKKNLSELKEYITKLEEKA